MQMLLKVGTLIIRNIFFLANELLEIEFKFSEETPVAYRMCFQKWDMLVESFCYSKQIKCGQYHSRFITGA